MNYRYITYSGRVNGGCARQTLEDHGWSMVLGTVVSNAIEVWTGRCPQAHRKRANSQDYPKNRGEEWRSSSTEAKAALYAGLSHKGALFSMKLEAGIGHPPPRSGARFQQSTSCCRQSRFQILSFPSMLHSLSAWQGKNDSGQCPRPKTGPEQTQTSIFPKPRLARINGIHQFPPTLAEQRIKLSISSA